MDKIEEETRELREALHESPARAAEELGDLLFSVANLSRRLGLDPESALREANNKFTERFGAVEDRLAQANRSVHQATLEEMEAAWQAVKIEAALPAAKMEAAVSAATGANPRGTPAIAADHTRPLTVDTRTDTPSVSTAIAPSASVLKIREPARSSRDTTSGEGCPNKFARPTLIIAICGRSASSSCSAVAVRLPWWPTLSTRSRGSAPTGLAVRSNSAPASPVSQKSTRPKVTRRTIESSFLTRWRSHSGAGGWIRLHHDAAKFKARAGEHGAPRDTELVTDLLQLRPIQISRHWNAFPDFPGREIAKH
jgi:hypothetical protein